MLVKKITIYCKLVGTQIILSVFRMMIAISKVKVLYMMMYTNHDVYLLKPCFSQRRSVRIVNRDAEEQGNL